MELKKNMVQFSGLFVLFISKIVNKQLICNKRGIYNSQLTWIKRDDAGHGTRLEVNKH